LLESFRMSWVGALLEHLLDPGRLIRVEPDSRDDRRREDAARGRRDGASARGRGFGDGGCCGRGGGGRYRGGSAAFGPEGVDTSAWVILAVPFDRVLVLGIYLRVAKAPRPGARQERQHGCPSTK